MIGSYEIRIKGRVGSSVLASFENMDSAFRPAETILRGTLDQTQLYGLIERIQLLGLELVELRRVPVDDPCAPEDPPDTRSELGSGP